MRGGGDAGPRHARLHVAVTADPYLPVPPRLYGGIERVIDFLVRGLVARGHRVTLIAHPESRTPAALVGYGWPPHTGWLRRGTELAQVAAALVGLGRVDVVHSFGRLAALLPVLPRRALPKVQSYQREVPWRGVRRAVRLAGPSIRFTGCSTSLSAASTGDPACGRWDTVFNGVDTSRYPAIAAVPDDAPLVFLGRIERIKGTHAAVAIARRAGRRLVIAGNVADREYFTREVEPAIDGTSVRYVGEVDDAGKAPLLGEAAALLMPIEWEEPFGIVMAEACACGTPVIGFARGSVPEVVRDGVNGFAVGSVDEAVAAVARLGELDRRAVRADCEARFGHDVIVDAYLRVYGEMLG